MPKRTGWVVAGIVAVLAIGAGLYAVNRKPAGDDKPRVPAMSPSGAATTARHDETPTETQGAAAAPKPKAAASAASAQAKIDRAAEKGRGRIYGTAKSPGGGEISVALHRVPDYRDADFDYDDSKVASVTAGADGNYEFTALPFASYVLLATATGYTINGNARLSIERPESEVTLTLVPGGTISGHVVNQKHEPIAGAHVFVGGWNIQGQKTSAPRDRALASQRRTDADGAFTLENLRKSLNNEPGYQIAVKAEGYATLLSDYIQAETQGVELVLKPGNIVSGRLVALENGEPLADKTVSLESTISIEKLAGKTDTEGFFFVSDTPPGTVTANLRDDELVITPDTAKIQVADGAPTADVELKAAAGGKVSGRVYDSDTRNGIANVKMSAYPDGQQNASPKEVSTNSQGIYSFKGLKPAAYRVEYRKPDGYPENYSDTGRTRRVSADLGKETTDVDFTLRRGLVITGRVVDESGAPVAQANVDAYARQGNARDYEPTAADGSFVVAGFSAGQVVSVNARKNGMALIKAKPDKGQVTVGEDGASGVELVMGEAGSIAGTLVTKSGTPKAGVQMFAQAATQFSSGSPVESTGPDGSVRFTNLAPGEYTFGYIGLSNPVNDKNTQRVTLRKGQALEGVRIIYPELGGLMISGRVKDTKGNGIARAEVRMQRPGWRNVTADAQGNYVIDGLSAGEVEVVAASYAFSSGQPRSAKAGDTNVDLVLKDLAKIEGKVVSAQTGQPVTNFQVRAVGGNGQRYYVRDQFASVSDPEGKFALSEVEEGATAVEVRADTFADASAPLSGIAGGETRRDVLVRMNAGVQVAGRVLDTAGNGVGGAQIFIGQVPQPWEQERQQRAVSSADGSFRLNSLAPGQAQLSASHPKFAPKTITASLTAGAENRVDIVMSTGGIVTGVVTLDGQPAAGANIYLMTRNGGGRQQAQTDPQGLYRIGGLPDGEMTVNVSINVPGSPGRNKNAPVQIADGMVTEANFDFSSGSSTIEGTVYEAPNQPFRGQVYVSLQMTSADGGSESMSAQSDGSGNFAFEHVPAGDARLSAFVPGGKRKTTQVQVGERQRIHKDIELYGGATIRVTVAGADASAPYIANLFSGSAHINEVSAQTMQALSSRSVAGAGIANGVATFSGIDPGTYTVVVFGFNRTAQQSGGDPYAGAKWGSKIIEVGKEPEVAVTIGL